MADDLCDVPGVRVGHATDAEGVTGCTAILFDRPATVGVDVRGASPGTRETDSLSPTGRVGEVHGLLLTGGSALGLTAADGVVGFLLERGVGLDVGVARVPIVPAAVIFDLTIGAHDAYPDRAMGYEAARSATREGFEQGSVGAGTGASVGKVLGPDRAMKGGLGSAAISLEDGLVVGALAVVNALGDVRDPHDGLRIVAGPRLEDGTLGDSVKLLPGAASRLRWGENTTLGVVATTARLTKPQATRVARMAHDGLARTVYPVHTSVDGDTVFAASVGEVEASSDVVGAAGALALALAIVRAVREARSLAGLPAARDLAGPAQ
ncbi:P1 family peptidase [Rubrobacter calidifluminis]|uniref:P1 family peptidase n=1 Tax=Rubrobacter calidifluminis TaxID=1392640 RepID=UPI00235E9854|nr:P1 family peptidase [Rubrobacter calidifluminis]